MNIRKLSIQIEVPSYWQPDQVELRIMVKLDNTTIHTVIESMSINHLESMYDMVAQLAVRKLKDQLIKASIGRDS